MGNCELRVLGKLELLLQQRGPRMARKSKSLALVLELDQNRWCFTFSSSVGLAIAPHGAMAAGSFRLTQETEANIEGFSGSGVVSIPEIGVAKLQFP